MNLVNFLLKRLGIIALSLFAIITITYVLMWLAPGNFFDIQRFSMSAQNSQMTAEQVMILQKKFEEKFGLDQPLWKQILRYTWDAFRFKFGPSFSNPTRTIENLIAEKFPVSLWLTLMSMGFALLVGVPLGVLSALKRNTWIDYLTMFISMLGQVIPSFVLAVFFVFIFCIGLGILPTTGWDGPKYWVLPVLSLGLMTMSVIARFMRSSLLDILKQDYIRTAYAKGGTDRAVIMGHAIKNALIPIVTILGPQIAYLLTGAVMIEYLFRIPGMGQLFVNAAGQRDYPLLLTSTYILALMVMGMNLIVDLLYVLLDPRNKLK
jgi:peptide/nickel transport system permease protein